MEVKKKLLSYQKHSANIIHTYAENKWTSDAKKGNSNTEN